MVGALNEVDGLHAEIATTDADGPRTHLKIDDLPYGIPIHLFRSNWSEEWKWSLRLWRWLRNRVGDYDVIHIHALWSFATVGAARAANRYNVPYILRPAGMLSDYTWRRRVWKKSLYWKLIERKTIREAAGFHATSTEEAEDIRAMRSDARVFVIPNGVDTDAYDLKPQESCLRERCGSRVGQHPILLCMSRLHPKKGIADRLLPAIAAMKTYCFLAIAGGEDPSARGYSDEVRDTVKRLKLEHRVALLGPVRSSDRWEMFDGADLFVLASHSENFGVVVAEAMARGCPVVVTEGVQSSEHVQSARAGEVVSGDVPALAGALDRMLAERQLLKNYGEAGRAYARRHFRWEMIARQVQNMYEECITTNRVEQ